MGYLKIPNLYKDQRVLEFKQVYALEKVHGTSAHLSYNSANNRADVGVFSGGAPHDLFASLFDRSELAEKIDKLVPYSDVSVKVYGEAYGGKIQGMSDTYGSQLQFIVFDVRIGQSWLLVPQAEEFAQKLGLEFVPYILCSSELDTLDRVRDDHSRVALRRLAALKPAEGIVIRPPFEVTLNDGARLIAKHKRAEFRETATPREVDPEHKVRIEGAQAVAREFVTPMRLEHVLDKLFPGGARPEISDIQKVIKAVLADIEQECSGEYEDNKDARREMSALTVKLFKARLNESIQNAYQRD